LNIITDILPTASFLTERLNISDRGYTWISSGSQTSSAAFPRGLTIPCAHAGVYRLQCLHNSHSMGNTVINRMPARSQKLVPGSVS
jgi:hypothetical protein